MEIQFTTAASASGQEGHQHPSECHTVSSERRHSVRRVSPDWEMLGAGLSSVRAEAAER